VQVTVLIHNLLVIDKGPSPPLPCRAASLLSPSRLTLLPLSFPSLCPRATSSRPSSPRCRLAPPPPTPTTCPTTGC
jgi:hypothetical protein